MWLVLLLLSCRRERGRRLVGSWLVELESIAAPEKKSCSVRTAMLLLLEEVRCRVPDLVSKRPVAVVVGIGSGIAVVAAVEAAVAVVADIELDADAEAGIAVVVVGVFFEERACHSNHDNHFVEHGNCSAAHDDWPVLHSDYFDAAGLELVEPLVLAHV